MTEAILKISNTTSIFLDWSRIVLGSTFGVNYIKYSDPNLVQKISSKELKEIYENYGQAVFRLAKSILKTRSAAEDLVHDVFIRFTTKNNYDPNRGTILNYLLMLTQSMALNQISKTRNRKRILRKWTSFFEVFSNNPNDQIESDEKTVQVQIALAKLPDQQRQVLELCYINGASHSEVSKKLNIPLGTVKTNARRGLIALRAEILTTKGDSQ